MQRSKNLIPVSIQLNEKELEHINVFYKYALCKIDAYIEKLESWGLQDSSEFIFQLVFRSIIRSLHKPTHESRINAIDFMMRFTAKYKDNIPELETNSFDYIEEIFKKKYGFDNNEKTDIQKFGIGLIETKYFSIDASLLLCLSSTKSDTAISIYIKGMQKPMIVSYLSEEARDDDYSLAMKQWSEYKMNRLKQHKGNSKNDNV